MKLKGLCIHVDINEMLHVHVNPRDILAERRKIEIRATATINVQGCFKALVTMPDLSNESPTSESS